MRINEKAVRPLSRDMIFVYINPKVDEDKGIEDTGIRKRDAPPARTYDEDKENDDYRSLMVYDFFDSTIQSNIDLISDSNEANEAFLPGHWDDENTGTL
jgi:hypothetical protein